MADRKRFTVIHAALLGCIGGAFFWYLLFKVAL